MKQLTEMWKSSVAARKKEKNSNTLLKTTLLISKVCYFIEWTIPAGSHVREGMGGGYEVKQNKFSIEIVIEQYKSVDKSIWTNVSLNCNVSDS